MISATNSLARSGRIDAPTYGTLIAALLSFAACYGAIVAAMVQAWSSNPLYSYGFLVALISAYVCWLKWQEGAAPAIAPDYPAGLGLVFVGVLLLIGGRIGSIASAQYTSLVVTLTGVVLLIFGRATVKRCWFPLAYLLLMVPVWDVPIDWLQNPSRLASASIAVRMLETVGVPVLQRGTDIVLPFQTMAVMRECSGVNQLVAMIAMVLPVAYLWLGGRLPRILLLALAIVISYASNGFRIAFVGWLAYKGFGDGNLLGSYTHVSEGLIVAMAGYAAVAGCFSIISYWQRRRPVASQTVSAIGSGRSPRPVRRGWLDALAVAIMLGAAATQLLAASRGVTLRQDLTQLPTRLGEWTLATDGTRTAPLTGVSERLVDAYPTPEGELRFAGVDDQLVREYRNADGVHIQLYVGYYRRQEEGKELTNRASAQLRLAGSTVVFPDRDTRIGEVVRADGGIRKGILYWYDVGGRVAARIYVAKAYAVWNSLTRGRSDGAIVMIGWQGADGATADEARRKALEFAQALIPVLRQYLPS